MSRTRLKRFGDWPPALVALSLSGSMLAACSKPQTEGENHGSASEWTETVTQEGMKQRWAEMSFEKCVATRALTIASLNIPPSKTREILSTGMVTMTRICLDDGGSLLITCSKPDNRIIITESPHDKSVGCPGRRRRHR
jgi:hypothetical protein